MSEPLCLLTVHAHPDDEASKGAGTVAKYHDQGVRTVLVCCTGGEEGDILNPAMDRPEVRERLHEVRLEELAKSAKVIGYDEVVMLGYRDSGMPDTEPNARPEAFANADPEEAIGRLVEVIRSKRPQVIITYNDDQAGYPHPDHLQVHDISIPAFEHAGDADWHPELGEAWRPSKLYYTVWSRQRMVTLHQTMVDLGVESPFTEEWFARPSQDHRITTSIEVEKYYEVRRDALISHATQVDPTSPFWFGLPDDAARKVHPYDEYVLALTHVEAPTPEDDLFAGIG